jgi:hypothetical protein
VVVLILALLEHLFACLAEAIGQITAGDCHPVPQAPRQAPRQAPVHPRPRQRAGRRPSAMPAAGGVPGHADSRPRNPDPAARMAPVPAATAKCPRPGRAPRLPGRGSPGWCWPGSIRRQRRKPCHTSARWHARFITIS